MAAASAGAAGAGCCAAGAAGPHDLLSRCEVVGWVRGETGWVYDGGSFWLDLEVVMSVVQDRVACFGCERV